MPVSNVAPRRRMLVEKSHSLSFSVRVEDRLHSNIIQPTDKCWFTVRPVEYTLGTNDTDITVGTTSVAGTGVRADAVISGTGEQMVFRFDVQAAMLNLDPELDYWYDVTYSRDKYSMSVAAGPFELAANVTNRGAADSFVGGNDVFNIISTVDGKNLLTVTASMPMPQKGDPGAGSYITTVALPTLVGNTTTVPLSSVVAPGGRKVQVGDVIFSSTTRGVLATVQTINTAANPATVTLVTRQTYGKEALKALMDTELHVVAVAGTGLETVDAQWIVPKTNVPLPPGFEYTVGDMLFSHSMAEGSALNRKMLVSLVEVVGTTTLTVRTKFVFPIFISIIDIKNMMNGYVQNTRTINGFPLSNNLLLSEDDIPAGATNVKYTRSEQSKVSALPTKATLDASLAAKASLTHLHPISDVRGLQAALDTKVTGSAVTHVWAGTQSAYDAITTKSPTTIYFIKG